MRAILDTNILTALFKGDANCIQKYNEYLDKYETVHLSVVVYYEIYRGLLDLGSEAKLQRFNIFAENCILLDLNKAVMTKAAEYYAYLKKRGQLVQDADILIAATAIVHNLGIVTDNESHFSRIPDVKIENWLR